MQIGNRLGSLKPWILHPDIRAHLLQDLNDSRAGFIHSQPFNPKIGFRHNRGSHQKECCGGNISGYCDITGFQLLPSLQYMPVVPGMIPDVSMSIPNVFSILSVWSRDGRLIDYCSSSAVRAASSRQDLICALATGETYSMGFNLPPAQTTAAGFRDLCR